MNCPQIKSAIDNKAVLLLPLGQTEQHGPHLVTGCDTIIAERVAMATAEALGGAPQTLVMPSIPYGYNPRSVQNWPGVFRIGWDTMIRYIADVLVSAVEMGFEKIIVLSTHGPHADVARMAARDVFDRTHGAVVVSLPHKVVAKRFAELRQSPMGGCSHAGEYETALLMHFGYPVALEGMDDRDSVDMCNEWISGDFVNGSGKVSWTTWGLQISERGVYGDPSVATAETGRLTFEALVEEYCELVTFVRAQELPPQSFPTTPGHW